MTDRIRVVLFDLDDTLFDHRGSVELGIVSHLAAYEHRFGRPEAASVVDLWNDLEDRHYHRYLSGELTFAEQRRQRALDFAAAHGVSYSDAEADEWFDVYFESYRESWRLFDDADRTLTTLERAGIRIGVITNGDDVFQRAKLDALRLTGRFEHIVASGAVGVAKPDRRIFEHACALFGVAASEAAYVGDRLQTDAVGAARAGLTGLWLNRFGADLPLGAIGHGVVSRTPPLESARAEGVLTIGILDEVVTLLAVAA